MGNQIDKYTYRIEWSEEDKVYIARCLEFPSLAAHGDTQELALKEIKFVVKESIKWLDEDLEQVPEPFGLRKYKGNLTLRVSPQTHRLLAIKASEEGVSINQLITSLIESSIDYHTINQKIDKLIRINSMINDKLEIIQSFRIKEEVTTDLVQTSWYGMYGGRPQSSVIFQDMPGRIGVIPSYATDQYQPEEDLEIEGIVSDKSFLYKRSSE